MGISPTQLLAFSNTPRCYYRPGENPSQKPGRKQPLRHHQMAGYHCLSHLFNLFPFFNINDSNESGHFIIQSCFGVISPCPSDSSVAWGWGHIQPFLRGEVAAAASPQNQQYWAPKENDKTKGKTSSRALAAARGAPASRWPGGDPNHHPGWGSQWHRASWWGPRDNSGASPNFPHTIAAVTPRGGRGPHHPQETPVPPQGPRRPLALPLDLPSWP